MGVIKRGILGGFSGKVANVIGGSWKGVAYMRSAPLSVANPKTAGQVAQRSKFSAVVALAKLLLVGIVKPCWDRFAQGQSGYNAFVSQNIGAFNSSGDVDGSLIVTSQGSLLGADVASVTIVDDEADVIITWADNSGTSNALSTDEVYAVAFDTTGNFVGTSSGAATRDDGTVTVTCSENLTDGDEIYVYLAFRRADGTLVSNSSYKLQAWA